MNCVGRMFSDNLYGEIRRKSDKCQGMSTSNFQWRHDGLGCINDYVENQHFNIIIVANEKAIREQEANKLESDKIAIGYAEIKEKVVERQLAFQSEVPVKQDELRSNPTS